MGNWVRCDAFGLLFVSRYSIATVFNLTATAVFTLTAVRWHLEDLVPILDCTGRTCCSELGQYRYGGYVFAHQLFWA
ncbi:hypothetical protein J1N35_031055 [Gossypium stocksii]|uniref:Uncharacterized protein n=1 Tax=Gossypium stocksii TaxID=47602 RepID=A0A9D3ZUH4_9ROSI|nr:hypothetical protein J1N35_031055 [Gossypium stocksii]